MCGGGDDDMKTVPANEDEDGRHGAGVLQDYVLVAQLAQEVQCDRRGPCGGHHDIQSVSGKPLECRVCVPCLSCRAKVVPAPMLGAL